MKIEEAGIGRCTCLLLGVAGYQSEAQLGTSNLGIRFSRISLSTLGMGFPDNLDTVAVPTPSLIRPLVAHWNKPRFGPFRLGSALLITKRGFGFKVFQS